MFSTLYLLRYNNYYNRIVKKEDLLEAYSPYIVGTCAATNFKLNDGLMTNHIVNIDDDTVFDYAILADPYGNINSRWFVIESDWQRKGQYNVSLYRDTIVDFYEDILNAPCFIEKATLAANSPFIFNNENMAFNQIKTDEYLLKDKSGIPWLVGYYAKKPLGEDSDVTAWQNALRGEVKLNTTNDLDYIPLAYNTIEDWTYYAQTSTPFRSQFGESSYKLTIGSAVYGYVNTGSYEYYTQQKSTIRTPLGAVNANLFYQTNQFTTPAAVTEVFNNNIETYSSKVSSYINQPSQTILQDFLNYNGKLVKTMDSKFYRVTVNTIYKKANSLNISLVSDLGVTILNDLKTSLNLRDGNSTDPIKYTYNCYEYTCSLAEVVPEETLNYNLALNKLNTTDAAYNIFAIPYADTSITIEEETINIQKDKMLDLITGIKTNGGNFVYDIQLLPYCPYPSLINEDGIITFTNEKQYSFITNEEDINVGIIIYSPSARFSFNIPFVINPGTTAIAKKINNECSKWRLAAPNYSNYFDFIVEKNGGINFMNVDCEYKPYSPYIHINPDFKNLYGKDFNDPRGLVLGGDFSLTQVNNEWINYQIQNKNYEQIFGRQIENMEFNNSAQRITDITSAIAGVTGGAMSGAIMGSIFPGVGTLFGGLAGGVASAGAGAADIFINEALRNEALDYSKDMFGYQLGNIQALPQTLSKITAINPNNKIFPVLEYYTSTEEEKIAFANKLAYNGMTTMVIGKIKDYIDNSWSYDYTDESGVPATITNKGYIKGQIIRLEDLAQEYHFAKAIAKEISLGIYI